MKGPPHIRFFAKVEILPGKDACWNWKGSVGNNGKGHGQFWNGMRKTQAHHFLIPPVPKGMEACHRCDNPRCVRPSHIFIGTHSDNMQDCVHKGRLRFGNGLRASWKLSRKLTPRDVRYIRKTATSEYGSKAKLARKYGVSSHVIFDVLTGRHYRHVT